MKPPLDHKVKRPFVWVPSASTDVGRTIKREQARLKAVAEEAERNAAEANTKVKPMRKVAK